MSDQPAPFLVTSRRAREVVSLCELGFDDLDALVLTARGGPAGFRDIPERLRPRPTR